MAKKAKTLIPMLAAAESSEHEPPSHEDMLRDSAHRAHRDVVAGWVAGEKSERQVKQSRARLKKALAGCGK